MLTVRKNISKPSDKYEVTRPGKQRPSQHMSTSRILISEVGFLAMFSSQVVIIISLVTMMIMKLDYQVRDIVVKCMIILTHSIITPVAMSSFSVMELFATNRNISRSKTRIQRRRKPSR